MSGSVSIVDRRALVLALGTFAVGTDAFVIAGILPEIARDLSTKSETPVSLSLFSPFPTLGSSIASALSATWPRKVVLVGGLATFAVANVLSAVSSGLVVLLATRVLAALSAGLFAPAAYALGATMGPPETGGRTLAVVVARFSSATVLGVPLGVLIGQHAGWRGTLAFVAAVSGAAALAISFANAPASGVEQRGATLLDRLRPIGERRTIAVLLPFLIWSIATYALYTFVAPLLEAHLSPTAVPIMLLVFGAGGVAGNLLGGALYDAFGTSGPTRLS